MVENKLRAFVLCTAAWHSDGAGRKYNGWWMNKNDSETEKWLCLYFKMKSNNAECQVMWNVAWNYTISAILWLIQSVSVCVDMQGKCGNLLVNGCKVASSLVWLLVVIFKDLKSQVLAKVARLCWYISFYIDNNLGLIQEIVPLKIPICFVNWLSCWNWRRPL